MLRVVIRARRALSIARCGSEVCHDGAMVAELHAGRGFGDADMVSVRRMSSGGDHTSKWLSNTSVKTPMELIAEVPPIVVKSRIVACEGTKDPALGHPIEYINLDLPHPQVCKYCGLRYVQDHGVHGHH